uniref:Acyl-CoA oxidase C-alpha1 domain-containing protein n=1 Tax=Rhizophagus irregularis (strain DAOM 181602 / DAOM 197198 / MUCL 43194) TaxID=747089 RepID=U9T3J1_RHIID
MQQYRLFPIIAQAYTTQLTSGLTSLTTMMAVDSIEDCRKTCGGHDYSNFSGFVIF